jgi:hypothetical protein
VIDVFVCTNEVNYTIAIAGELRRRPRLALVLYDPVRSDRRHVPRAWQRPFNPWSDRLVRTLGRLRLLRTVYIPHHRVNPRLMREVRRARAVAYLDDGLDTLRHAPLNFEPVAADVLPPASGLRPYLTFTEYKRLPPWLDAYDVRRICSMRELLSEGRKPTIDLTGVEHLFVESPGLQVGAVIAALGIDPARCLCVRHPVPAKRGALPALCRVVDGRGRDLEATVLGARGLQLYFGSTMTLVFALQAGAARHNAVHVQLDDAQRTNLLLPGRQQSLDIPGLRPPLMRALADEDMLATQEPQR